MVLGRMWTAELPGTLAQVDMAAPLKHYLAALPSGLPLRVLDADYTTGAGLHGDLVPEFHRQGSEKSHRK